CSLFSLEQENQWPTPIHDDDKVTQTNFPLLRFRHFIFKNQKFQIVNGYSIIIRFLYIKDKIPSVYIRHAFFKFLKQFILLFSKYIIFTITHIDSNKFHCNIFFNL